MPDSEMFKVILQGGSFGLLAIFIVWLLFYGAPMFKNTLEKMSADHKAGMEAMDKRMEEVQSRHEDMISALHTACREERREDAERWAKEREEDRKVRHDMNNWVQSVIVRNAGKQP